MNDARRGFVGTCVVAILALVGIHPAADAKEDASDEWIKDNLERLRIRSGIQVSVGHVNCGDGNCPPGPMEEGYRIHLMTSDHHYAIVVKLDYMGCVMSNRLPLYGEDWTRGCDLADGKKTKETWSKVMQDIVAKELVPGWNVPVEN